MSESDVCSALPSGVQTEKTAKPLLHFLGRHLQRLHQVRTNLFHALKGWLKRQFFHMYRFCELLGVHITPVHYYSPLPHLRHLEQSQSVWAHKSSMVGVRPGVEEQGRNLIHICSPYLLEYVKNVSYHRGCREGFGQGYGEIDAQALHAVVRHFVPKRVIEVGGGVSTFCIQAASRGRGKHVVIEPYPKHALQQLRGIELLPVPVQTLPPSFFDQLENCDLLFVDSSHIVKTGSDVNYLILEVLPRLATGVLIHFHDIYFPYDYQPKALLDWFHNLETSLLRAYLTDNLRAEIVFSLSWINHELPDLLRAVFPNYRKEALIHGLWSGRPFDAPRGHLPNATYLRKT